MLDCLSITSWGSRAVEFPIKLRFGSFKRVAVFGGAGALMVALLVVVFVVGRESASDDSATAATTAREFDYSILNDIRNVLGRDYVKPDNLDDQTLFEAAVNGMLNVLNDSGTYYVAPEEFQTETIQSGSFDGIGATVSQENNEIVIVEPIRGTPAERAGLQSGDVILAVDGDPTKGWTTNKAVLRIRGPRNTQVTITIRHPDGKTQDYTLTRDRVLVESVRTSPPGGTLKDANGQTISNIGYIQIREFSARTAQELDAAIKDRLQNGAKGLIIDVRYNLGGLLDPTIRAADLFLDSGIILSQRNGDGRETVYKANNGQGAPGLPVVILQNRFSASAAEVLAAALQDNGRATIVGEKSFGKGTVNVSRELDNGGAVRVSIAQWLSPSGTLIDKVGVRPDVEVILTDEDIDLRRDAQLFRAIDILRGQVRAP